MKDKIKYFLIPFVLMIIFNLGSHYFLKTPNLGDELNPHVGVLFISGLFFGPAGISGAVIANFICDIINGYTPQVSFLSEIITFLVSYMGYKIWYTLDEEQSAKIRLNNTKNLLKYFFVVLTCGILYSLLLTKIVLLAYPNTVGLRYMIGVRYLINYINFSLLFSIILIWLSRVKDFAYKPKVSKRNSNPTFSRIIFIILVISVLLIFLSDVTIEKSYLYELLETILLSILILLYATKPIKSINDVSSVSIPEKIMDIFLLMVLIVVLIYIINIFIPFSNIMDIIQSLPDQHSYLLFLLSMDIQILIIFIPSYFIIRYIEKNIVKPLMSFSKMESRLVEDEKIESDDLIDVYSNYSSQKDEIGMLSRSYINLINYNNNYIENIKKAETEKQRIQTELDIAYKIQQAILPNESIKNEYIYINGFSRPAKEVGGDFFDYYELDDEYLAIVIGDSSGKGVPAALFSTLVQNSIEQHLHYEKDPAKILTDVNHSLCKKNSELMFITLWLGIYNMKTHKLLFANGGHNPPIIKKDGKYIELSIDSELVLGIDENYTFTQQEVILDEGLLLYTDGVTDSQNEKGEFYGEDKLFKFLNSDDFADEDINNLIDELDNYTQNNEQFDDVTAIYLKIYK